MIGFFHRSSPIGASCGQSRSHSHEDLPQWLESFGVS